MKRNKRVILVLTMTFAFLLIGGGIVMQAVNKRDKEEKRMTPEELIEYFGFTEEEIEGVDIEKFLKKINLPKNI